ncbi:hypothetical protein PYCC9005_005631 [Savitreella phatthalungensis]
MVHPTLDTPEEREQDPLERLLAWHRESPDAAALEIGKQIYSIEHVLQRVSAISTLINESWPEASRAEGREDRQSRGLDADVVGLWMDLEQDLYTGFFACWAAGCTPTVLNLAWPSDVLEAVVKRLGISIVLHNARTPPDVDGLRAVSTSSVKDARIDILQGLQLPKIALVNQSSGSTGTPKSIPAATVVYKKYCPGSARALPNGTRTAYVAAPSFSNTTAGLMVAGYCRNTVLYPAVGPEKADAAEVAANVRAHLQNGATQLSFTSSIFGLATAGDLPAYDAVRNVYFGGEITPVSTVQRARQLFPNASITVGYGSTEALRAGFSFTLQANESADGLETIEYTPNSVVEELVLLDDAGEPVELKAGAKGTICVVTRGAAEPYVRDQKDVPVAATADTFRETSSGECLINFGDVGELVGDGKRLKVSGRSGRRIKLNGVFVDLAQLDHLISTSLPTTLVKDAHTEQVGNAIILVYVSDTQDDDLVRNRVNALLSRHQVKVPVAHAVYLAATPIAVSGKKDLKVLQKVAQEGVKRKLAALPSVPEADPVANFVSSRAAELVKTPELAGKEFLFVEAGLDSISAVHLLRAVEREFGVSLSPAQVIDPEASPSSISTFIAESRENAAKSPQERGAAIRDRLRHDIAVLDDKIAKAIDPDLIRNESARRLTVFLTGASGFAGAFIAHALLTYDGWRPGCNLIVHVRAGSAALGKRRVVEQLRRCGLWEPEFEARIECVPGDLDEPRLGLSDADHREVCHRADVVVHNAARVHWLQPYSQLKPANADATADILILAATTRLKRVIFISGGSQTLLDAAEASNDYTAFATANGYSHAKYVAEQLTLRAYHRGIPAYIVRPGFILGSAATGVSNTDDFVWRLLKTSIEIGAQKTNKEQVSPLNAVFVDDFAKQVVLLAAGARTISSATPTTGGDLPNTGAVTAGAGSLDARPAEERGAPLYRIWRDLHFTTLFEAASAVGFDLTYLDAEAWVSALKNSLEKHASKPDSQGPKDAPPQAHGDEIAHRSDDVKGSSSGYDQQIKSSATARNIDPVGEAARLNKPIPAAASASSANLITRGTGSSNADGHPLAPVAHTLLGSSTDGRVGIAKYTIPRPTDLDDRLDTTPFSSPGRLGGVHATDDPDRLPKAFLHGGESTLTSANPHDDKPSIDSDIDVGLKHCVSYLVRNAYLPTPPKGQALLAPAVSAQPPFHTYPSPRTALDGTDPGPIQRDAFILSSQTRKVKQEIERPDNADTGIVESGGTLEGMRITRSGEA